MDLWGRCRRDQRENWLLCLLKPFSSFVFYCYALYFSYTRNFFTLYLLPGPQISWILSASEEPPGGRTARSFVYSFYYSNAPRVHRFVHIVVFVYQRPRDVKYYGEIAPCTRARSCCGDNSKEGFNAGKLIDGISVTWLNSFLRILAQALVSQDWRWKWLRAFESYFLSSIT